jgi:hypothetical protein
LLLAAALLTVWEMAGRSLPRPFGRLPPVSRGAVACGAAALVAAFWAQLALLAYQTRHDGAHPAWVEHTPLLLFHPLWPLGSTHWLYSLGALLLVCVQTAGLATLVAALARMPPEGDSAPAHLAWRLTPFVAAALAALALWSPAVSSDDVFGYVGLGLLGAHPFDRPAHFFSGEYAAVFDAWPLRPTIYGPLWTAYNAALVSLGGSFTAKVMVLRATGAVLLGVLTLLTARIGRSRALTAAVVLNPMLWFQYVSNAHNDLLAICLLVGAVALVERSRPMVAMLLVAAAGLIKIPFVILGTVAFARQGARRAALFAAGAIVTCLALSALLAGRPYYDALRISGGLDGASQPPLFTAAKLAIALGTLGVTAFVVLRDRFPAFGGLLSPAIAPNFYPWYLVWAVPYALATRATALPTLLAFPLLATLADGTYGFHAFTYLVPLAALCWIAWAIVSPENPAAKTRARVTP